MMTGVIADLRHAWRVYRATPIASGLAVLVLAAAMAFVSGFLSLWDDLALVPHAGFANAGDVVTVGQTDGVNVTGISLAMLEDISARASTIESIAGSAPVSQVIDDGTGPQSVRTELVSAQYFAELAPRLALGRPFDAQDHASDAAPVAVLSYRFWQQRFGGRSEVLGETVQIRGPNLVLRGPAGEADASKQMQSYRIVGVMAPSMTGSFDDGTDVWLPFEQAAPALLGGAGDLYRQIPLLMSLARPRGAADPTAISEELNERFAQGQDGIRAAPNMRLDALRGVVMNIPAARDTRRQVDLFLAGSLLVALVAACNVSLFLLSRIAARRRELGIRMAVGAPLKRLARQLSSEAGLLVAAAVVLGLLGSVWLSATLRELPFLSRTQWRSVSPLDWRVLAIVALLAFVLTALVSMAPVLGLRRTGIAEHGRSVTARAGLGQRLAGTAELAVAGLVGGAAFAFLWYSTWLGSSSWGFDEHGVAVLTKVPPQVRPGFSVDDKAVFAERERVRQTLLSLPGVDAVAFGTSFPGRQLRGLNILLRSEDGGENGVATTIDSVDYAYADVLGMTLVDGRNLEATDANGVLVNEALARAVWGRVHVAGEKLPGPGEREIIGVLRDAPFGHPSQGVRPMAFFETTPTSVMDSILVKGGVEPAELRRLVQGQIDNGALDFEIANVESLAAIWNGVLGPDRARSWLTSASAALVALLAAFGFYGMQRYLVTAGRREYAVRAAVGAGPKALSRLVLRRTLALGAPGAMLGTVLAFTISAWMRGDFVSDVVSPAVVALAVAAVTVVLVAAAAVGPARQARGASAGLVLREE